MGETVKVRNKKGEIVDAPKRLETWRITSPTRELIEQAAELYGGTPEPWESPTGPQWEVVTTSAELPVLIMPGYSLRQSYEHRTSPTSVERRCDGIEMDDGRPCACNGEGFAGEPCKLVTRLTVALPELTTMLGWRLETKGENAARELLASMDLVQGVAGGRPFVPARLRIVERRGAVDGQAVRYVVPVIDVQVRYAELVGQAAAHGPRELPGGYVPIPARSGAGVSLEEGLVEAERQQLARKPRVELPEDDEILDEESAEPVDEPEPQVITQRQRARLFAIAGERGVSRERLRGLVREITGQESTAGMTVGQYEELIAAIETRERAGAA
jgi:hypothetical protein